MKKEQILGQLRFLLTATGTALATWGFTDGHSWEPVIGIIMVLFSLTWGFLYHKKPGSSGKVYWSLVRKAVNIIGTALVTYGYVDTGKVESIDQIVAALGPILAGLFSFIGNGDGKVSVNKFNNLILMAFVAFGLSACSNSSTTRITPDGCIMFGQKVPDYPNVVWFGACNDNRWVAEWEALQMDGETLQKVRAEYSEEFGVVFKYAVDGGWIEWSSKSGIVIGAIPAPVVEEMKEEEILISQTFLSE